MSGFLFHAKNFALKVRRFGSQCLSKLALSTIVGLTLISWAEATGPLRINTASPRYFADSSGKAVYLAGSYQSPYNLLSGGAQDFSAYFDFLAQQNHNFTRLWAWEQSPWTYDQGGQIVFTLQPYERTGPGTALDGGLKFDLTRFNEAYFDQLRTRIIAAGQRGIYVSLILFEGFSTQRKVRQVNPWLADPFQRDNNINGINADPNGNGGGEEFFSLSYPSLTALQEAFVRKLVDTLNDLDNVVYEISGDTLATSLSWQYYMIDYLKSYQATKLNQHPVGISQFYTKNLTEVLNSQADWIVIVGTDFNPPLANSNKILFLEGSPILFRHSNSDQWVWRTFTRGYNPIYPESTSADAGIEASVHAAIGQTRTYSQFLNLRSMSPSNTLCSTGFCLASQASEYLVYLPSGGQVSVDLSGASVNYLTAWFDPASGQTMNGNTASGGKQALTSPIRGQSVLQILSELLVSGRTTGVSLNDVTPSTTNNGKDVSPSGKTENVVAAPTITPKGGTYLGSVKVTLETTTPGASIYYTTDGQSPTQSSKRYAGSFALSSSTLVKAKAFKNGMNDSSEASVWFAKADSTSSSFNFTLTHSGDKSVNAGSSASNAISATLSSGSVQAVSFTVSGLPSGTTASFSSASCSPTCSSTLTIATSGSTPAGNFPVTVTSTGGGVTKTTAFTLSVAVPSTVATPTIAPNGGSFTGSVSVTMQTATSGASIYYSTNGSSPTQSSMLYTGAMTLTSNAVVKAKAFKSGSNTSAEASASFTQASSGSGLVAHWKFDEGTGTTVSDSSGNGNTGTLINGPLWSVGRMGNALYFDGTDDNVTVLDSNSLDLSGSFTLSAWVNPASSFTDFRSILVKNYKYYLYASVAGYCGDGSPLGGFEETTNQLVCEPSPLSVNTWTHLTLVSTGSTLTLYRDGVAVSNANVSGTLSSSTGTLQIGASEWGEYFKGLIDEVRIYNRALSDTEVRDIYQAESGESSQTVATPVVSPTGGNYSGSASVTMQTATAGASIYYTTNGSTPTQSSTLYTGATTLTSSATVKAKAFKNGYSASAEAAALFTVSQPFSFSLSNSGNQSVVAGSSVSNSVAATLVSGISQAVSFSVSGLPSGASGSFSSTSCGPACGTVLTITTSGSTPTGVFPITVTSTGGGVTKTTAFTLSVTLALTGATPTITPTGTTGTGKIYYVAKTGSDSNSCAQATSQSTSKLTINSAVACLGPGDTLYVKAGTYNESLDNVIPAGTSWTNVVTVAAFPGETVTIKPNPGAGWVLRFLGPGTQYIVIDGFILDATNVTYDAVKITYSDKPANSAHHIRIKNSELKNAPGQGVLGGISCEFINLNVHNNGRTFRDHGFYFGEGNNLIEGSKIHHNAGYGVHIYNGNGNGADNNIIRKNLIYANNQAATYGAGAIISSGNGNMFYNNVVYGTVQGGSYGNGLDVQYGCTNCLVYNNTVYSNGGVGINVGAGVSGTVIRNNIVYNNTNGTITDLGTATVQGSNLFTNPGFVNPTATVPDFRLQSGSPAIDVGANLYSASIATDFDDNARPQGLAYDIGAYEYVRSR